jgi:hypothetical protein
MPSTEPFAGDPRMALHANLLAAMREADQAGVEREDTAFAVLAHLVSLVEPLHDAPRIVTARRLAEVARRLDPDAGRALQ